MKTKRFWTATAVAASMLMTVGSTVLAAEEPVTPALRSDGMISLEGAIEYKDLEGGFYSVGGWALIGDSQLYSAVLGEKVIVTGKEFTGISTRMVQQIEVEYIARPVGNAYKDPVSFTVEGKLLKLDQGAVVENGKLMLPLRAIVEAAGGSVEWVQETRTVNVTMPDRKASFVIGEAKAEMNENGHYYLVRNMLPMDQAPILRNGRTLISAEAVTTILGLTERVDMDQSLDIVTK